MPTKAGCGWRERHVTKLLLISLTGQGLSHVHDAVHSSDKIVCRGVATQRALHELEIRSDRNPLGEADLVLVLQIRCQGLRQSGMRGRD
jgi:hypothetical protein